MTPPPARIVLLTPTLAGADGVSCLARQFADALAGLHPADGVDVWTLAEADAPGSLPAPNVRVHATGGSRTRYVLQALIASRRDWAGTLVVVLHLHLLPVAWPLVARGACLLPVLVGIESWRPQGLVRRRMLARVPRALAISAHTAREFARTNPGLAALPVNICHPAVPPLADPGVSPVDVRPPFALIVGRMSREERYKGHDVLMDVWPDVRARVPGARLVVAGGGDDLPRLQQSVRDAGLGDAITFTGPVSPPALAALYRDCAFFVLPSRQEGFGFVLLEAMSHGRACIGGTGAASEIIDHGATGLVVDPRRPAELTAALVLHFTDDVQRRGFGEAGLARARAHFAPERFARDLFTTIGHACQAVTSEPC